MGRGLGKLIFGKLAEIFCREEVGRQLLSRSEEAGMYLGGDRAGGGLIGRELRGEEVECLAGVES